MNKYYVIYKTYYLFNHVGGYMHAARILVPGVLLQQALFPELECRISRSLDQKRLFKYRVRISETNAKSLNLTPKPLQAYSCSVTCDTQKSDGVMFVV